MFDNKWQKKEMPLVSLIGMGGGIASPAFLASIVLNILKPTVFSPIDDTGVPDFDYTAESSAITNVNQIQGGWSSASFDSNGNNNQWQSVAYGNGKYVALALIGNAYLVANSTDGINWTSYNTIPYTSYSELAYGNGAFVAVGNGKLVYSTDEGESWSSASVASNWWKGVTYGGGKFVAVAEDGTNRVATSSDGINWSETSAPGNYMWLAVTYGGGKYVAVSQMGDAMYSSNGTNWSTTSVPETGVWNSVAYGNGKFVAVAGTKTIYSTDGINWSSGNNTIGYWKDITFGDGRFVAVSNYQDSSYPAVAGYSTDGDTWTPSNQAISGVWNGVDYVNGRFIAVAGTSTPKIMWSPTGVDEATELTLTDTTVSRVSNGSLIGGESIDQVLTVGETVQADTAVTSTVTVPVFTTTLWSGTGSAHEIVTGIDNTANTLLWTKSRNYSNSHRLYTPAVDAIIENPSVLYSNISNGVGSYGSAGMDGFTENGFTVTDDSNANTGMLNSANLNYVAWNFRAAPGFLDIVTYTSQSGVSAIDHNLGSVPGCIIVKKLNSGASWQVYHKDLDSGNLLELDGYHDQAVRSGFPSAPTSTQFFIDPTSNNTFGNVGDKFVAYLFAEDTPGLIKCGIYTGNGNNSQTVNLGFETGLLITKPKNLDQGWMIIDSERKTDSGTHNAFSQPNQNHSDNSFNQFHSLTNTGFTADSSANASNRQTIYIAIAKNAESDVTGDFYATGEVSASSGNTITLSNTTGTWSTGTKVQGVTTDTKDNPDPIKVEDVSLTSSAPTAERNVNTWGDAVWEIATDENFTQNVQTATTALSATGTQAGPSFTLEKDTGYYTRTKYTALGQESEWSNVTYFVTASSVYVDDVFSTYLYEGNSTSGRTITNGIDLSGEGGLVWIKERTVAQNNMLIDTVRGATKVLVSNSYGKEYTDTSSLTAFNNDGFTINNGNEVNHGSQDFVSWTFRKAPGFFDIVTYTGNGNAGHTISHNLGSVPGMIIIKNMGFTEQWQVWHRSVTGNLELDNSGALNTSSVRVDSVTSTSFNLTSGWNTSNASGQTFVAYIFAHDDQSFGTNGDESIIKCGSYTGSTSAIDLDLGFEPQWVMIKRATGAGQNFTNWAIFDNMRGVAPWQDRLLAANLDHEENGTYLYANEELIDFTSTGITIDPTGAQQTVVNSHGETYIYMAIRRPHKPATVVTDLFDIVTAGGAGTPPPQFTTNFPVDLVLRKGMNNAGSPMFASRLQGETTMPTSVSTNVEGSASALKWDYQNGWSSVNETDSNLYAYMFKRSPGFMDVVTYKGTGSHQAINHNLGVSPEMMIVKSRNGAYGWAVYHSSLQDSATRLLFLHSDNNAYSGATQHWGSSDPTSTSFTVANDWDVNRNGYDYVAYLFATQPGISKVGSYTAAGAGAKAIDCGFTNGAAFIIVKNASSDGDWYLLDSERGINAYNETEPYITLNNAATQQTANIIGYKDTGFMVNGSSPLNNGNDTYIFYAIANP